ncbi:NAD(P)-binding protein [Polyplosphaeria fusca]|uniref:D-xylose 1-dehydrogenase (NADP(+), D-xylono-1,5-lactone-forming) n=1 Tax=Polyplosphaeria fusca TaxID=682080 RepID=A0A9P4V9K5_9PLEO|nr:NAD(P)-binding protein [Polyplosphaeria fusca]
MASVFGLFKRNYQLFSPPTVPKTDGALRFGILGAANIAPMALIIPAKSHAEVIVAAVAARDPVKANAYAKKHGIPIVHKTYDDLINDPSIDCIYNPLPNGLHYVWTIKALKAGKHVLLEKPSVSNSEEAQSLFRHPLLSQPNAPVLLEAFHYTFHPAWRLFLTLFDSKDVQHVEVNNFLPFTMFPLNDIRFNYSLSGGTLMDFGSYAVSSVRGIYDAEPSVVTSASYRAMPPGYDTKIDHGVKASYEFPNGGTADIAADHKTSWATLRKALAPNLLVTMKPKETQIAAGRKEVEKKVIHFTNYMGPQMYHKILVTVNTETLDAQGKVVKIEHSKKVEKAYSWAEKSEDMKGEDYWATYRYQLEAFVNRVKGRKGSGVWVDGEDSIKQMELIDRTYEKLGLPARPTSEVLQTAA